MLVQPLVSVRNSVCRSDERTAGGALGCVRACSNAAACGGARRKPSGGGLRTRRSRTSRQPASVAEWAGLAS